MKIGVAEEIKQNENRVALMLVGADTLVQAGHSLKSFEQDNRSHNGTVKLTVGKQHESNWADRNLLIHGSRKDHLRDETALLSLNLTVPIHILFRFIRSCLSNGQRGFW